MTRWANDSIVGELYGRLPIEFEYAKKENRHGTMDQSTVGTFLQR